jgi:hypothetical protein
VPRRSQRTRKELIMAGGKTFKRDQKRRKEMARKLKQEEKLRKKIERKEGKKADGEEGDASDEETSEEPGSTGTI